MKRQKDSFRYRPSNTMPWQMEYLEFCLIQDGSGRGVKERKSAREKQLFLFPLLT